jgi:hypothetical protein
MEAIIGSNICLLQQESLRQEAAPFFDASLELAFRLDYRGFIAALAFVTVHG